MSAKKELFLHEDAMQIANEAIYLTGPGRTGSTVVGKIIQSFKGIEYAYEPPVLHSLLPLLGALPTGQFRLLYETLLYEDLLMGQITGRAWNFNRNEESCIFHTHSEKDVADRLKNAWTKTLAMTEAKSIHLVLKMTDIIRHLSGLKSIYPNFKVVLNHRSANSCIDSLIQKKWFSDESLSRQGSVWLSQSSEGIVIPQWVPTEAFDSWSKWKEFERAAFYYACILKNAAEFGNAIIISYDKLVLNPKEIVESLAAELKVSFGSCTSELVKNIRAGRQVTSDWISKLPGEIKKTVEIYSNPENLNGKVL